MYQDERKLDFKPIGMAIKKAREAKGWTQEHLAQLVDLTPLIWQQFFGQFLTEQPTF